MLKGMKFMEKRGKDKSSDHFISTIRGLYLAMNFMGSWPRTNPPCWYKSIWYIHSLCLAFHVFGLIAGLIVQRHDTKKIIHCLGMVIPTIFTIMKWVTFAIHKGSIKMLIHFMEKDWANLDNSDLIHQSVPNSKRVMTTHSRFAKMYFNTSGIMMLLAIVNYGRDASAARNSQNNSTDIYNFLPIPNSWYPVDYDRSFNIQVLVVTQTFTTATLMLVAVTVDTLFIVLTLHLYGQFKILRYFIESITYDSTTPECCETKVRLMVKRHQLLLRVSENLQESYGYIIFEQLVACTLTVCFLGYIMIVEMEKNDTNTLVILDIGFTCGLVLLAIFTYCLVGDLLTDQSNAVAMAAYNAQWYNCTRKMSRSFLLVMIRAGRPVEITGANVMPMSLETFTVLMKAAASYLSVLRTMGVNES